MIGLERKFSAPLDRERGMRRFSKLFRNISPAAGEEQRAGQDARTPREGSVAEGPRRKEELVLCWELGWD